MKLRKGHTYKQLPAAASVNPSQSLICEFFLHTEERTTAKIGRKRKWTFRV